MELSKKSIAGYVALTGESLRLGDNEIFLAGSTEPAK
jgi:hypothetical protein